MTLTNEFDDLLDRVADGVPIDWEAAERLASSSEQSAMLRELRVLSDLRTTHREASGTSATAEEETRPAPDAPAIRLGENLSGTTWGKFRLLQKIGQGGFGVVYRARDKQLDREVAIKLLHPRLVTRDDVKAEGRALAKVDHPSVLTVYGVEEHNRQLALCMKYIRGRTLEDIIRSDGPMNADEAVVVARAICGAVAAVHAANVLHRDIKARNIMRERNGRYVLMDFGAGVMQAPDGSSGDEMPIGTPLWMAPELFDNYPATKQTDVYALGILLYYLVTGDHPVTGKTRDEIKAAHRAGGRIPLDDRRLDLPQGYVEAVERATAAAPGDRPQTATALLRELERSEKPDPSPWRLPPWAQTVAVTAVSALGLAAVSGWLATNAFNAMLDRTAEFAAEGPLDILAVGFRSLLIPALLCGALLGATAIVGWFLRIVPGPVRLWTRALQRLTSSLPEKEYAAALAQLTVVAGVVAVAAVLWWFGDVVSAFTGSLSEHPLDRFDIFRPENLARRVTYRYTVVALFVAVLLGWRGVRRVRLRTHGNVPTGMRAAGVVLIVVLMVLSQAPYKAMGYNELPILLLEGTRCYLLGERANEVRVFCPANEVPRVRTVKASQPGLERCDADENVFLASTAASCPLRAEP